MKKNFFLLFFVILFLYPLSTHASSYIYRRTITLQHGKIPNTDQTNFPMEYAETDSWLATVGNGGKIQHTTTQTGSGALITVPADLVFATDASCTSKLNWEIEKYNSSNGDIVAWIKIPTASHSADTVIYECYDSSAVTTWQGNVTGTWDSHYKNVTHLPDGTTLTATDTVTSTNQTINASTAAIAGQIDGGAQFGNSASDAIVTDTTSEPTTATYEIWSYRTGNGGGGLGRMFDKRTSATQSVLLFNDGANYDFDVNFSGGQNEWDCTLPSANAWHHVVVTYDNSSPNNDPTAYIDGATVGCTLLGGVHTTGTKTTTSDAYVLGNRTNDNARNWAGNLDEFRISDNIRTSDWISAEYNNQSATSSFYTVSSQMTWVPLTSGVNHDVCNGVGTSISATAGAVSVGDIILVDATYDIAPATGAEASDNLGNTYTTIRTVNDPVNGQDDHMWVAFVTHAGTPTVTLQFDPTPGVTTNFCVSLIVDPFSGSDTSSTIDGSNAQYQNAPGTGADAVSSGTFATTIDGDLVYSSAGENPATAGTGQTGLTFITAAGGAVPIQSEYKVQSTHSGSTAGTWTAVTGTDLFNTIGAAITPASGNGDSGGGGQTVTSGLPKFSIFSGVMSILKGIFFIR